MFVGTECPHCVAMRPLVAKLQFDTGIVLDERDVWKSRADDALLEKYRADIIKTDPASSADMSDCDGIPFFYNTKTGGYLCGEVNYKTLHDWATKLLVEY